MRDTREFYILQIHFILYYIQDLYALKWSVCANGVLVVLNITIIANEVLNI